MPLITQVEWLGYEFEIYSSVFGGWREVGGLYVFAGRSLYETGTLLWQAYYIGQTEDFSSRIPTHENWPAAALLGATHVHVRVEQVEMRRLALEEQLIETYDPPLNLK